MYRMTKIERIADIADRCNLSEETVRAVLKAEHDSMMDSLKHGEKVTLAGRVIVNPIMRHKLGYDSTGQLVTIDYCSATAKPLGSVLDELSSMGAFDGGAEVEENKDLAKLLKENRIQVMNIPSLE